MLDLMAAANFATFVGAGFWLAGRRRDEPGRRKRLTLFLLWVLIASFVPGVSQRDAWPFSSWPLAANDPGGSVTYSTIAAVDADGHEHPVDYRAWQPLGFDELLSWIQLEFPKLTAREQDAASRYLLGLAERARRTATSSGRVGTAGRLLGPLKAPDFLLHPRLWPRRVPSAPFVGLRVYSETLVLDDPARGGGAVRRALDYEYP